MTRNYARNEGAEYSCTAQVGKVKIRKMAERDQYGTIHHYTEKVRAVRPVVQCITNIVTVNDCANALLAVGASPTMAHHPEEMADFAAFSDSLVCNMGATESLEAMERAMELAAERGHPIVVDPVGCAGSAFRRKKCLYLIGKTSPSCIRGNASEIRALALDHATGKGVDDFDDDFDKEQDAGGTAAAEQHERQIIKAVAALSRKTGAIVIASGETDYIGYCPNTAAGRDGSSPQTEVKALRGGSPLMARITGSGCMLSALLGGFLAAEDSPESAMACCAMMNRCGELAEARTRKEGGGTGTFHIALMDALSSEYLWCQVI